MKDRPQASIHRSGLPGGGARGRELPQNGLKVCALSNGEHIKVMVHPTSGSQDSKLERSLGR